MSNLLLITKSKAKHYRTISNHGYIEDKSEDLLIELKNYRSKNPKKFKNTAQKSSFRTPRICNSEDLRQSPSFPSPKINIQEALMLKHTKILEKYKLNNRKISISALEGPSGLSSFLDHFRYFKDLKIEVELNSEIVKNKPQNPVKLKGIFSLLSDMLNEKNFKVGSSDEILKNLKELCCIFRDILRTLSEKAVEEETVCLELVWRLVLKLFDSSILLQESTVSEALEKTEKSLKEMNEKCSKKISDMRISMEEVGKSLRNQISEQASTIKFLKRANYCMEDLVKQKEAYIADLLEPESQDKSCEIMRGALKKLNLYIREAENEQMIQANTLKNLSTVIALAEDLNKKPENLQNSSQTTVSLFDLPLPFKELRLSDHPFSVFYSEQFKDELNGSLLLSCEAAFNKTETDFQLEVLLELSNDFDTKKKIQKAARQLVKTLNSDESCSSQLYRKLLGLDPSFPRCFDQVIYSLNKSLLQMTEGRFILLSKFLDFFYSSLDDNSGITEKILAKIGYFVNGEREEKMSSLLSRLFLAASKSRNIENLQDLKDENEIKKKIETIGWVVSSKDLDYFYSNLLIETTLGELLLKASSKVFYTKLEKNEIVLEYCKQLEKKTDKTQKELKAIWEEENIDNFCDLLAQRKEISERSGKLAFVQNLLNTSRAEILEKTLDFDFSCLKSKPSLRKKSPKKTTQKTSQKK